MRIKGYSLFGVLYLAVCLLYTRLLWRRARLIRLPFRSINRGKLTGAKNLTTGVSSRIDIFDGATLHIGDGVQINDYVHIGCALSVEIGDNCLIASRVFITDHDHDFSVARDLPPRDWPLISKKIIIGKNCWIGEGVSVLKGVELGDGCVVGANSVVTKSFPDNSILVGCPAKLIRLNSSVK